MRNGELEAAEQTYRQALALDANAPTVRCGLAYVLIKNRQHAAAYEELRPLLQLPSKHSDALALSGLALVRAGLFRDGFESLKAALAIKRDNPIAIAGIAELACYENQLALAAQLISTAINESPEEPDYYLLAARIASRLENFYFAAESLRNFLRLAPKTDVERRERIEGVIRFYTYLGTSRINVVQEKAEAFIPFELRGRRPHINVRINGKGPFNFVLDTGASSCVISNETAAKIGVRSVAAGGYARAVGGNGMFPIVYGVLKSLEIGPIKLGTVPVYLRDIQSVTENGSRVDGFIGLSTLSDFAITLDYPQHLLGLRYAPREGTLKDGAEPAVSQGTTRLPFRVTESGLISLETQLDDGQILNFILDSGASASVVDQSVVERHNWQSKILSNQSVRIVGAAGAAEKVPVLQVNALRIYDLVRTDVRMPVIDMRRLNESSGFEQSGILGGDFLTHCRIEIDFRHQRIALTPTPNGIVKRQMDVPPTASSDPPRP
ncbi:aspartyl protease family protein [Chloracidobacterium validum]|uniref:Aspartyl protease family protein n=1 Tax=Chloracidobacterium validum TaxID=2821543 RepID=A0ABX8B4S2_9BACT|nr:aspartyl protease family protein [Chloracidobacterium validum]QUW01972.1 aspartyl protease family protein [Chloracidobacterium validum]